MNAPAICYRHPDGGEVVAGDGLLTVVTENDLAVSLPIGHECLAELGHALIARAAIEKRAEESADAGEVLARELVGELHQLLEHPPCESARALEEKLRALEVMADPGAAAQGFARVIAPLLMDGIYAQEAA